MTARVLLVVGTVVVGTPVLLGVPPRSVTRHAAGDEILYGVVLLVVILVVCLKTTEPCDRRATVVTLVSPGSNGIVQNDTMCERQSIRSRNGVTVSMDLDVAISTNSSRTVWLACPCLTHLSQ